MLRDAMPALEAGCRAALARREVGRRRRSRAGREPAAVHLDGDRRDAGEALALSVGLRAIVQPALRSNHGCSRSTGSKAPLASSRLQPNAPATRLDLCAGCSRLRWPPADPLESAVFFGDAKKGKLFVELDDF